LSSESSSQKYGEGAKPNECMEFPSQGCALRTRCSIC
jgi:hypothetical protein